MTTDQVSEFEVLRHVAELLDSLNDEAAAQRVVRWSWDKYVGSGFVPLGARVAGETGPRLKKKRKAMAPRKKETIGLVKDLNVKPADRQTLAEFVSEKNPQSVTEKSVVCVYYLSRIAEIDGVSLDHIYTAFKALSWRLPKDLRNMVHQAGSKGWLETKDRNDITVTIMGENHVEHDLPRDKASASA